MKPTIKDVAREAKVSIATVSYVINGMDKVKKQTKERVLAAIEKLNYVPDQAARTMINKKTRTIGMIVRLLSNEYWAELAETIQSKLMQQGYTLIISTSNEEMLDLTVHTFMERNVDGVFIGSSNEKFMNMFREKGFPLVSFVQANKNVTYVGGDNLASSVEAVEHLIGLGHRKIAFIGSIATGIDRELGYRNALMMNNIDVDESMILSGKEGSIRNFSHYGYDAVHRLVAKKNDFTGIFCSNDLIAIGAIKALDELGFNIPDDKAVVGFDNITMAGLYRPSLTTIGQPIEEIASAAVEAMMHQIENPGEFSPAKKITFPMQLIVRESTVKLNRHS